MGNAAGKGAVTAQDTGLIRKSTGGLYTVEDTDGTLVECRAKGAFRHEKLSPLTGDRVAFDRMADGSGFITDILPRRNVLVRPAVANVDLLALVIASAKPEPDLFILDKLTAIAAYHGIEVLLIINKCDLRSADALRVLYTSAGIRTVCLSASRSEDSREALDEILSATADKVCFFSGASGVGKTSLLNALYPALHLATGDISRRIERGKHTTRVTELYKTAPHSYIGDTPGFSMVDVAGFNLLPFDGLLDAFPDIEKYAHGCRYTNCTHLCEEGCRVMQALAEGDVQPSRHESYVRLYKELEACRQRAVASEPRRLRGAIREPDM